jgi:type I restriction enzyme S subunit
MNKSSAGFESFSLEDCTSAIIDYRGKTPRKVSSGIPLITAKIVKHGRIEPPEEFVDEREYAAWMRRGIPVVGDVLLTTEAPLGEVAQVTDERIALAQRLILLRGKPELLDNTYLKFLLMSEPIQSQLRGRASGTTVTGIKQSELRKVTLTLPPVAEQRAIAAVLGVLDDKIEQNRQSAQALEQLAQAIFQAWLVDFDPVKAKAEGATSFPSMPQHVFDALPTRFVECEIGAVPEGWEAGTLGSVSQQVRHGVEPGEMDPATPYIGLEHMPRRSITLGSWGRADKVSSGKTRFRARQILFGKLRPYFHKVGVAPVDGMCSTDVVVVEPKSPHWFAVVLGHVASDEFVAHTSACSSGTKMPRTTWGDMGRFPIAVPPIQVGEALNSVIVPMIDTLIQGVFESRKLAEIRDYLLPRLLSGEVCVGTKAED